MEPILAYVVGGSVSVDQQRLDAAVAAGGEQFERAAAVGLGAVVTVAGLGHGVVAAVRGRCPKDIRRPETIRGRTGMPSTARSESFEAVDVHGVARQRSPSEQARRHRRGRASPVVSLALEKLLVVNVRRKRLLVSLSGKKSCDINEWLNSERFRSTQGLAGWRAAG
jgi:hypothetical protein